MEPQFIDEELAARMPWPLSHLYVDASLAKSALERHQSAFYLWEAAIKITGAAAVIAYVAQGDFHPQVVEQLRTLARPALGHWWSYIRLLVPLVAERDVHYARLREFLFRSRHDDLPRLTGLHSTLREVLQKSSGSNASVNLEGLLDDLVNYRNREIGHGAAGRRGPEHYDKLGRAMAAGAAELLQRMDPLAGRDLLLVDTVSRDTDGAWVADCFQLKSQHRRRRPPLRWTNERWTQLLLPQHVYLAPDGADVGDWQSFYPLAAYDGDAHDLLLMNSRPNQRRSDFISYRTGAFHSRPDILGEQQRLLGRVFQGDVAADDVDRWAVATAPPSPDTTHEEAGSGRFIGDFELLTRLGKGAMGIVYKARQAALDRHIALKCQLRVGDPKADARFQREIRALGRVSHPNLVRVFTSGNDGDQWYYAMELVEGTTLGAVSERMANSTGGVQSLSPQAWRESLSMACDDTRRSETALQPHAAPVEVPVETKEPAPRSDDRDYISWVVELVRQAAEATHALHEAGIIHRDIKPGNIMVSTDGERACLMDLGLAQLLDESDRKLTRTRQFVGTLRYASPEQVLAAGTLDRRADVYSLGATLWELLTLQPIFSATEETPAPELMRRIQFEPAPSARKYNPRVSRDLDACVLKSLEKNPARRYSSAQDFADDLARVLRHEPTLVRPSYLRSAARALGRRAHPLARWSPVFLALVLAASWGYERLAKGKPGGTTEGPASQEAATVRPAQPGKPQPESYAVIVGVLQAVDDQPLKYSEKDALDVAEALKLGGFAPERIRVLCDSEDKPTKAKIQSALHEATLKVGSNGVLLFYFSGQGFQDAEGNQYLAAADSTLHDPSSCLETSELDRILHENSAALHNICIVDACRAMLGHRGPPYRPNTRRPMTYLPPYSGDAKSDEGRRTRARLPCWFFSVSPGEVAMESQHLQNGIFTHFLVQGLTGKADANIDQQLSLAELTEFVTTQTSKYVSSSTLGKQTPQFLGEQGVDILLVQWPKSDQPR